MQHPPRRTPPHPPWKFRSFWKTQTGLFSLLSPAQWAYPSDGSQAVLRAGVPESGGGGRRTGGWEGDTHQPTFFCLPCQARLRTLPSTLNHLLLPGTRDKIRGLLLSSESSLLLGSKELKLKAPSCYGGKGRSSSARTCAPNPVC